jgi:hypothetical protein
VSAARATTFEVLDGFLKRLPTNRVCSFSGKFKALGRTDQPCPSGRGRNYDLNTGNVQEVYCKNGERNTAKALLIRFGDKKPVS